MGRTLSMAEIYAFRFGEQNKVKIFIQCSDIITDLIQGIKKSEWTHLILSHLEKRNAIK